MTREEARADLMLAQANISYRPKDESIDMAIEALENQKTGHWIKYNDEGLWECSECGEIIYSETEQDRKEKHKYCNRCGAKMEGEN